MNHYPQKTNMEPENGFWEKEKHLQTKIRKPLPDPTRKLFLNFKLHINDLVILVKKKCIWKKNTWKSKGKPQTISFNFQGCLPPLFFAVFVRVNFHDVYSEVSRPNVGAKRLTRTCPQGPSNRVLGPTFPLFCCNGGVLI